MGDKSFVVIGGGIVGTAIALELQSRGARTTVVERDAQPQGATAFSFGSLSAFDEPLRDVYLLKTIGLAGWRAWANKFGPELGVTWDGEIRWTESRDAARHLLDQVERAFARGYPVRRIRTDEIAAMLPTSTPGQVMASSLSFEDGQVEPRRAVETLRRAFRDLGGDLLIGRASLVFDDAGVDVRVGEELVHGDAVVVAAGAETSALLERFGWDIPMEASPGFLAVTAPMEPFLPGAVYVTPPSGDTFHLRQLASGEVLLGERTQEEVAHDPSMHHAEGLLQRAQMFFPPMRSTTIDRFTVEWRPMPRDRSPIVGALPGAPSIYVAAAHSGITLAPAIATLAAEELLGTGSAARLGPFRPARFARHGADALASIEDVFAAPADVFLG